MDQEQEYQVFALDCGEDGEINMAVLDSFDYNGKTYVVVAEVKGDSLSEESSILRSREKNGREIIEFIDDEEFDEVYAYYQTQDME